MERLRPDQIADFQRCFARAMGFDPDPVIEARMLDLFELPGCFCAFDGAEVVGTVGAYRFGLSTPGGPDLDAVGTTVVGVLPTHRRRGILRSLMAAHLGWAREAGLHVAGLWASEPSIYPRFGYGLATRRGGWSVDTAGLGLDPERPEYRLRYVDVPSDAVCAVYEAYRRVRAGALTRSQTWWRHRRWNEDPMRRGSFGAIQLVVAELDDEPKAYLQYRRKSVWEEGRPRDVVLVEELIGEPAARRALWRLVLEMDLVAEVVSYNLPVDEPLPWLLGQHRGASLHQEDALWLLPLDPIRLLTSRRFTVDAQLRMELTDSDVRSVALEVEGGAAHAEVSAGLPHLKLRLADLPALVWGEVSATLLEASGRLDGDAESLAKADLLFSTATRPWCSERF